MFNILTLNNISSRGLEKFTAEQYTVSDNLAQPDAILLRSYKMHDFELPESVLVVGRAGAGTNNIPINQYTDLGIPVLNTPGANANAVKELVITGMLLACRNICPAWDYTHTLDGDNAAIQKQVEQNKKRFAGFELPGKTLGIIGLGNIGVQVANAARNLGMKVIGYDPAVTVQAAWQLRSSVTKAETIDEVINQSDFVTVHVPLMDATRHLINAECLQKMPDGVVLLNLARDGIVDNDALLAALKAGKIRNYVCDFPNRLLMQDPRVICLPHLGASTKEAEENCAMMIADQVKNYLEKGHIVNSVNFPAVKLSQNEGHRLAIVNRNVPNMVAQISTVLSNANLNIVDMINKSRDEVAYTLLDLNTEIPEQCLNELQTTDGIVRVRVV
ncbi:MAG: phosphoglycerate dehydrogenase [Gammaproteobacteria bacterium]|nr:phosphoglycerate dehydrogenase [Gammaproteobacteria bacterium]